MHANQQFYLRSSMAICNIWSSVGSSSSNCPNHHLRLRRHCVIKKSSASEEALKLWKTKDGRNLTLQTSNLWTHYELDFKSDRVWWGGVGSFPRSSPDPFLETKWWIVNGSLIHGTYIKIPDFRIWYQPLFGPQDFTSKLHVPGTKLRELMLKNNLDFGVVEMELKKSRVVSHGQKKEGKWVTKQYLQTTLSWTKNLVWT